MRRFLPALLALITVLSVFQIQVPKANAAIDCTLGQITDRNDKKPASDKTRDLDFPLSYDPTVVNMPDEVNAYITYEKNDPVRISATSPVPFDNFPAAGLTVDRSNHTIKIEDIGTSGGGSGQYFVRGYEATREKWRSGDYKLTIVPKGKGVNERYCTVSFTVPPFCRISLSGNGYASPATVSFHVTDFLPYEHDQLARYDLIGISGGGGSQHTAEHPESFMVESGVTIPKQILSNEEEPAVYQVRVSRGEGECKSRKFTVAQGGGYEGCQDDNECDGDNICLPPNPDGTRDCGIPKDYVPGKVPLACAEKTKDIVNDKGTTETVGTGEFVCQTAIGEINTDPNNFGKSILALVLSLAGMILLALLILNGYKLMTSQGDPEKIKDAREGLIAAIAGILLIIFSLSIIRFITTDILGIPGFS